MEIDPYFLVLESLQMVRKHRTIQADKLRSMECCYLVNYIVDFRHNKAKFMSQMDAIIKQGGTVTRNEFWRGKVTINASSS